MKILFRIAIAIIQKYSEEFLKLEMEGILNLLKEIPTKVNIDEILKIAYSLSLSHRHIDKFEAEFREKNEESPLE